ncbi:MAG: hypothetical protein WAU68_15685 [Vitreimonas sp.]
MKASKWWIDDPAKLQSAAEQLRSAAPRLRLVATDGDLVATGVYELEEAGVVIDRYAVRLVFGDDPDEPPAVWETDGVIPRVEARHVTEQTGACCVEVYGEHFARTGDRSLGGFLRTPFRNYFISQSHFVRYGEWPFEERSHGLKGMVEAYAELAQVHANLEVVARALALMTTTDWKGHWRCPCGGTALRSCCGPRLRQAREAMAAGAPALLLNNLKALVAKTGGDDLPAYTK